MLVRFVVCGLMGAARLLELRYSTGNLRTMTDARESRFNRLNFAPIAALNTAVIVSTLLFGDRRVRWQWLALLLAAQPVRYWVIATLGRHWNVRAAVSMSMIVITSGPYAWLRHPNYSVLLVELAALPAAFGLPRFALLFTLANAAVLAVRVHEEEALLFQVPGYAEHFAGKRRFIPGVF
jgi:methyltransferase